MTRREESPSRAKPQDAPQVRISLMGKPHINHPLNTHGNAMQMLALLILAWKFLPAEQTEQGIERDWLADRMADKTDTLRQARDNVNYLVTLLDRALGIRTNKQAGRRERKVYEVAFDGMSIDVLEIQRAARQGRHPDVLVLANAPLLDGMEYPWLDDPFFQRVGATLDICCLDAFLKTIDRRITDFEATQAKGGSRARSSREEASQLLDKASSWLAARRTLLRQKEPALLAEMARTLTGYRVRAGHPLPGTEAETGHPHLPDPPTDLVGRTAEIAVIHALLGESRLVTLIGTGGLGKTRLALAVAEECRPAFSEVPVFADLAAVSSTEQLAETLTYTLGIVGHGKQSRQDQLLLFLADRHLLLVWDNCEQSIPACRALAQVLLDGCPRLRILATSREPLSASGDDLLETVYPVPALSLPEESAIQNNEQDALPEKLHQFDAPRLFAARARVVYPQFSLTSQNSPIVLEICRSLDGLPLGIELAAALLQHQSVQELAQSLRQRFAVLTEGRKVGTLRHSSLQAAFDLSYARLTAAEQQVFRALGVFVGGFSFAAAQSVTDSQSVTTGGEEPSAELLLLLKQLSRKSLLVAEMRHGEERYRLLETVRSYAQDRLRERGDWEEMQHRHRLHFLQMAEEAGPHLRGPQPADWLDRLETEIANFRAALEGRSDETSARLLCALPRFWVGRGHQQEARRWLEHCAGNVKEVSPHLRVRAWNAAGSLAFALGDFQDAQQLHEAGLALAQQSDDTAGIAEALNGLGAAVAHQGDYHQAKALIAEGLRLRRQLGDRAGTAHSLSFWGMVANYQCEYDAARMRLEESLTIMRQLDDVQSIANYLHNLGVITYYQCDYAAAQAFFAESLSLWQPLGDKYSIAKSLSGLGEVALHRGDYEAAQKSYTESLTLRRWFGDKYGIANSLNGLGEAALLEGDSITARRLLEESLALRRQIGDQQSIPHSLHNLGEVALHQDDDTAASRFFRESLRLMRQNEDRYGMAHSLESLAALCKLPEQAVRLMSAAEALRVAIHSPRSPRIQAEYDSQVAALRALLDSAEFDAAWTQGQAMIWEEAVAYALGEGEG